MAAWLLWFLPSFEAGFWSALIAGKLRDQRQDPRAACLRETRANMSAAH